MGHEPEDTGRSASAALLAQARRAWSAGSADAVGLLRQFLRSRFLANEEYASILPILERRIALDAPVLLEKLASEDIDNASDENIVDVILSSIRTSLTDGEDEGGNFHLLAEPLAELSDKDAESLQSFLDLLRKSDPKYVNLDAFSTRLKNSLRSLGKGDREAEQIASKAMDAFQSASISIPLELAEAVATFAVQLSSQEDRAISAALAEGRVPLSEPPRPVAPYPGKREAGPIDEYLERNYPYHAGRPVLTASYLRQHDPKALRAFYDLEPSKRARIVIWNEAEEGDALLRRKGIDVATEGGRAEARKVYAAIQSRVFRGMKPN